MPSPARASLQFVNIPTVKIPIAYPIEITTAAIVTPFGNVMCASFVWSTRPPVTSIPP